MLFAIVPRQKVEFMAQISGKRFDAVVRGMEGNTVQVSEFIMHVQRSWFGVGGRTSALAPRCC